MNTKLLLKFKILGCRILMGFPIIPEEELIESQVFILKTSQYQATLAKGTIYDNSKDRVRDVKVTKGGCVEHHNIHGRAGNGGMAT